MKRFVLDASIALAWFLDQPIAPIASKARQALIDGSRAIVPALWLFEIANGFAVAERRALITEPEANQSLLELDQLLVQAIDISNEMILAPRLLTLARAFRLSAYDAAYLETAQREGLPLATLDQPLRSAAVRAGVAVFR
ncbi:MAG TPA: type II toxin-antitoxin system VapC family toxin [Terriglobales bacterium]|nr:type II toxin-antitoxin system VapC family toxin [Terriglobales bacterium]